jgi:hypothetical protein
VDPGSNQSGVDPGSNQSGVDPGSNQSGVDPGSNQSSAKYYKTGYLFWVCTIKENIKLVISSEYVPLKRT